MIVGIDPGAKGAIGMLYPNGSVYVEDMPMIGKEVDGYSLSELFIEFPPEHVYLEQVSSWQMGRTSAFNFGQGCGCIKGVLATMNIPYTMVVPQVWKKYFDLSRDKDESRLYAARLWPTSADMFKRKRDDGRAEALLIAKYGSEL
jgi:crossover junction endodeoxyribonuclease RuvC|tara:strand:+ start:270 stop:704 length:435 start_codon:yes stop_codon:yes gene_type:complete